MHINARGDLSSKPLGRFEYQVDRADALVHEAVGNLTRHCPEHAIGGSAVDDLQRIKPHVEGALVALAEIESHRELTQSELSRRRAFRILLEGVGKR